MNESFHTFEWVISHIWMGHGARMNESCHVWMRKISRMNESYEWYSYESYLIWYSYESYLIWVICHFHISHMNDISYEWVKCHSHMSHMSDISYEWVIWEYLVWMSHMRISHMSHMSHISHEWVIWVIHVTHEWESYLIWKFDQHESGHKFEWVLSHIWTSLVIHLNKPCHTNQKKHSVNEVPEYLRVSYATYLNSLVTCLNKSRHIFEVVISHIWMSHVMHSKESSPALECGISHIWMSLVTHLNESCHTFEWVLSHIWMSLVTHQSKGRRQNKRRRIDPKTDLNRLFEVACNAKWQVSAPVYVSLRERERERAQQHQHQHKHKHKQTQQK